jgi:lambda family phage portal protein
MGVLSTIRSLVAPAKAPPSVAPAPKQMALHGRDRIPYDAASWSGQDVADWWPWLGSPDVEINPWRDRIVARIRDMVRNDGWVSGALQSMLDEVVGGDFRVIPRPDWRQLALYSPSFDAVWADEFAKTADALWRGWSLDVGKWCDGSRSLLMPQLLRVAFSNKLTEGDAVAQVGYDPARRGKGAYATYVQLIDPDRLSNPNQRFDLRYVRGGVEIDKMGAPIAYYIRRAHQSDWYVGGDTVTWDRIPRETSEGRPVIVHDFDTQRPGQHRGGGGIYVPVVQRIKMAAKKDQVDLQAAIVNAIFAAVLESPYDPQDAQSALQAELAGGDPRMAELSMFQQLRAWWHKERPIKLEGVTIPTLMSGEKMNMISAPRETDNELSARLLRNMAAATGQTYEAVSRDYSRTNYSSARSARLDQSKMIRRRRIEFGMNFCTPIYASVLEEWIELGLLPLPADAPEFRFMRQAYSACTWRGPGAGWVDPLKEAQASVLRMDCGISTLQDESADQGYDWEDQVEKRAAAIKKFKELGLQLPGWAHDVPANLTDTKPRPQ